MGDKNRAKQIGPEEKHVTNSAGCCCGGCFSEVTEGRTNINVVVGGGGWKLP